MENETNADDARRGHDELSRHAVPVDADDGPRKKSRPRQHRGYLPVVNAFVGVLGVVAVAWGVIVAIDTLASIDDSVAIAEEAVDAQLEQLKLAEAQLRLSRGQFTASLDALWLDQRPWLAFSRAETVPNEIVQGEPGTFRFHVLNSGKTPAFNVRLLRSDVEVLPNTAVFSVPSDSDWVPVPRATTTAIYTDRNETTTVFPTSSFYYDITIQRIVPRYFQLYTRSAFYIAVTARLLYCDANRSLHWTQLGVGKIFSETGLTVRNSTASLHPGEPDHPNCHEEAHGEP